MVPYGFRHILTDSMLFRVSSRIEEHCLSMHSFVAPQGRENRYRTRTYPEAVDESSRESNAKTSGTNRGMPIRPSSKRKESVSRNRFERTVSPWMVTRWESHDYGIDGVVEITRPRFGTDDDIVTGKRFAVQIKATSSSRRIRGKICLRVQIRKIRYWLNSTEPVMLVHYDAEEDKFRFLWIDDLLVAELTERRPNWLSRKTTTLRFPKNNEICKDILDDIEEYLIRWRRSTRTLVRPGEYFRLKEEAIGFVQEVRGIIDGFGFESVMQGLDTVTTEIEKALYVVAITGPSRGGKSTLLNAIVRHDISPIDILPTTGLPLAIVPGKESFTEVVFPDGKLKRGPATSEFLVPYISQEENPDNCKGVRFLTVHLMRPELERGISLLDMPGLDDPSPEIRQVTRASLEMAQAVIYVINAAPMMDGGFAVTNQIVADLQSIGHRADRLFLVFNKVDLLEEPQKKQMVSYVDRTLAKYKIDKLIPVPPILISARDSWENRIRNGEPSEDSVSRLESCLWDYLLNQSKTGLYRLGDAMGNLRTAIGDFDTIVRTRLMETAQSALLEEHLREARSQLPEIRNKIQEEKKLLRLRVHDSLMARQANVLRLLRQGLRKVPINKALPSNKEIRTFLQNQAYRAISGTYEELRSETGNLRLFLDSWIESMLGQVRVAVLNLTDERELELPTIPEVSVPIPEDLSGPVAGAVGLGLVGLIFGPIGGLFGAIFGWLSGLVLSGEYRRAKRIEVILKRSEKGYQRIFGEIERQMSVHVGNICAEMERFAVDRVDLFLHDVERQRSMLGTPLSQDEISRFKVAIEKLSPLAPRINELKRSIGSYYY